MKLDTKNTCLVGLAFMAIIAFWQLYDNVIPLMLTNTFSFNETFTGVIMAADNVVALILLPIFGRLSDKTSTRIGKRMPYILVGTIATSILLILVPIIDNGKAAGEEGFLYSIYSFVILLSLMLLMMAIFRTPAVALMPDITPKPLRSKGNAIINLMGACGGIVYLAFASIMFPKSKTEGMEHVNYFTLFLFMSIFMIILVGILFFTVKENKLSSINEELEKKHPEWDLSTASDSKAKDTKLPAPVLRSLLFLLASVALWYIAYNSITTWFTTYISKIMGEGLGGASTCFLVANVGAIVSYIPLGMVASKIGRKKSIYFGTLLLTICFLLGFILTTTMTSITVVMYLVFALVGVAWAAISVNSLPMVVEMCKGADSGKFTGYYYSASMFGQILTPVLSGKLMNSMGYKTLFIYATLFSFLSFITMIFVKHGDSRNPVSQGIEAFSEMD